MVDYQAHYSLRYVLMIKISFDMLLWDSFLMDVITAPPVYQEILCCPVSGTKSLCCLSLSFKGSSTYYIITDRGGGVSPKDYSIT